MRAGPPPAAGSAWDRRLVAFPASASWEQMPPGEIYERLFLCSSSLSSMKEDWEQCLVRGAGCWRSGGKLWLSIAPRHGAAGKGGAETWQHVEVCWGFPPCSHLTLLCSVHLEISFQKAPLSPSVLIEFRTCSKYYLLPDRCAFRPCLVKAPFITPQRLQSASSGKLGFSSLWELPVRKASAVMKVCASVAALKLPQSCYRKSNFPLGACYRTAASATNHSVPVVCLGSQIRGARVQPVHVKIFVPFGWGDLLMSEQENGKLAA